MPTEGVVQDARAVGPQAEEQRLAKQREDNLKRMLGQAGATGAPGSTGTALKDAAPSASYAGKLIARIKPNIVLTETVTGNPAADVEVRASPTGTILSRRLVKGSGNKDWDEAVLRAIDRTGELPRDTDGRVPPVLVITFTPQG
jgi:colicin import membrane protein